MTADDVVWSWLRTISPQLGADYAYQFYGIKGAQDYNSCKPSAANQQCDSLKSKVASRHRTRRRSRSGSRRRSRGSCSSFRTRRSFRRTRKRSRSGATSDRARTQRQRRPVHDDRVEARRVAHDGEEPGLLRRVEREARQDRPEDHHRRLDRRAGVQLRRVDVNETGWPPSDTPHIKSTPAYQQFPSLGVYYYGFNVKAIPDANQRKAMALAIDRQAIVDHITQTGQVLQRPSRRRASRARRRSTPTRS